MRYGFLLSIPHDKPKEQIEEAIVQKMYRQGDVMVVAVDSVPPDAVPVEREAGRVVLAHGEVTGHAHAIVEPTAVKLADGIAEYLCAPQGATLEHEEHAAIDLPAGNYRIVHQREYTPQAFVPVRD